MQITKNSSALKMITDMKRIGDQSADIADIIHNGRVAVNYNNIVLICAELLGQRAAHFAQTHNHDLHSVSSFPPDPYGIQLLRYRFRDDAKQQSSLSRCF